MFRWAVVIAVICLGMLSSIRTLESLCTKPMMQVRLEAELFEANVKIESLALDLQLLELQNTKLRRDYQALHRKYESVLRN